MEILEGANLQQWLQMTVKASVSDSAEAHAILAAHNRIVELERKLAASSAPQIPLSWEGGEPHWHAAVDEWIAVVVTLDDERVPEDYLCWIGRVGDETHAVAHGQPATAFTLIGAQTWCADRIQGLTHLKGAKSATADAG